MGGRSTRDYRDRVNSMEGFVDQRDSMTHVYLSLIPFLIAEYFAEISYDFLPPALIFPVGFLLFWAFYYTYYKPGFLENRLSAPQKWDPAVIPAMILGVLIWFAKITFVEISHLLVLRWIIPRGKAKVSSPNVKRVQAPASSQRARVQTPPASAPKPPPGLPPELTKALQTLGLTGRPQWDAVHRRYRELAKQFHPDLNPDITDFGRHFIAIDQAYRKLGKEKAKYFA